MTLLPVLSACSKNRTGLLLRLISLLPVAWLIINHTMCRVEVKSENKTGRLAHCGAFPYCHRYFLRRWFIKCRAAVGEGGNPRRLCRSQCMRASRSPFVNDILTFRSVCIVRVLRVVAQGL